MSDILSFLDADLGIGDVKEALEKAGVEVEEVVKVGGGFGKVKAAEVVRVERGDGINWVQVYVEGVKRVVATTDHVERGEVLLWADVPPKRFGDRVSEGMFLSEEELGLESKSERLARVQDPSNYVREFLLDDYVLHLYITPNRPDLLSVRGLALEVSAFTGVGFLDVEIEEASDLDGDFPVEIRDGRCDVYSLRLVRLGRGETPPRIRRKLHLVGFNPINPAVDATNWAAYILGQPLHAFDIRKVKERITVRASRDGERFVSLEGKEYVLPEGILLIADVEKPLAVAGVIGGAESGTYEDTEEILLESAHFSPEAIRRASVVLNVRTESSRRFERNVSPRLVPFASLYAAELLRDWVDASYSDIRIEGEIPKPRKVFVSKDRIKRYLGFVPDNLPETLGRLLFHVEMAPDGFYVLEPDHRTDIALQEDVIEEIARLIGYDNLPFHLPQETPLPPRPRDRYEDEIRAHLASLGAYEVITLGLFSKGEVEGMEGLRVISDFNESFSHLASVPVPHVLKALSHNQRMGNAAVPLFSIVRVYDGNGGERRYITVGITSPASYYDLKGLWDSLVLRFGWDIGYGVPSSDWFFHPHASADILQGGKKVGGIGALKHRVSKRFGLKSRVYLFYAEIMPKGKVGYTPVSTLPHSVKDVSFIAPVDIPFSEVDSHIRGVVQNLPVERLEVIDVYEGKPVPEGYRSYTYRFVIRPHERPLGEGDINRILEEILKGIGRRFEIRR